MSRFAAAFFKAIEKGDTASVARLLRQEPFLIHANRDDGWTGLHVATSLGKLDVVALLLYWGADVHRQTKDYLRKNVLEVAASSKKKKTPVDSLLKLFYGPSATPNMTGANYSVLDAAESGLLAEVERGAARSTKADTGKDGWTVVLWLALYGTEGAMRNILSNWTYRQQLFLTNESGIGCLHTAAFGGNPETVGVLLGESSADLNVQDKLGNRPMHYAMLNGHTDVASVMLSIPRKDKSSLYENNFKMTPLHMAAIRGHTALLTTMLNNPEDGGKLRTLINYLDVFGMTALHYAVIADRTNMPHENSTVRTLLSHGADPNSAGPEGWTPLIQAVTANSQVAMTDLIAANANVNAVTKNGWSVMHYVVQTGDVERASRLLVADVDLLLKNDKNETPVEMAETLKFDEIGVLLHAKTNAQLVTRNMETFETRLWQAVEKNNVEGVNNLIELGMDPTGIQSKTDSWRPLHLAANNGFATMTHLFLHRGVEVNVAERNRGMTPLHMAVEKGNLVTIKLLMAARARADISNRELKTAYDCVPAHLATTLQPELARYQAWIRKVARVSIMVNASLDAKQSLPRETHTCRIPGETLIETIRMIWFLPAEPGATPIPGTLYITSVELVFVSCTSDAGYVFTMDEPYLPGPMKVGYIEAVTKFGGQQSANKDELSYGIEIRGKDGRKMRFAVLQIRGLRRAMYQKICEAAFPSQTRVFAFTYKMSSEIKVNGWDVYDPLLEYQRQGVDFDKTWRVTHINFDYGICPSYPANLVVPFAVSDITLTHVANFRSKGRIPVLTYHYAVNGSTITRCSQPMVGIGRRSTEDEALVEGIWAANQKGNRLQIVDARPKANAYANTAKGAGFESTSNYPFTSGLEFLGIGNIHVMRECLSKVFDLCDPSNIALRADGATKLLAGVEATKWLVHLSVILTGALRIANLVHEGISVMIHCSDGWDRTAQLSAVASLILDPFYRTMTGFMVLVEKDWLSFGHKFGERLGHGENEPSNTQRSPIFLQFLDCIWQIMQQFPTALEFNEDFLLAVADGSWSCQYGTFLFNNEFDRRKYSVKTKTVSLWTALLDEKDKYRNGEYQPLDGFLPVVSSNLQFWMALYCRQPGLRPARRMTFVVDSNDAYDFGGLAAAEDDDPLSPRGARALSPPPKRRPMSSYSELSLISSENRRSNTSTSVGVMPRRPYSTNNAGEAGILSDDSSPVQFMRRRAVAMRYPANSPRPSPRASMNQRRKANSDSGRRSSAPSEAALYEPTTPLPKPATQSAAATVSAAAASIHPSPNRKVSGQHDNAARSFTVPTIIVPPTASSSSDAVPVTRGERAGSSTNNHSDSESDDDEVDVSDPLAAQVERANARGAQYTHVGEGELVSAGMFVFRRQTRVTGDRPSASAYFLNPDVAAAETSTESAAAAEDPADATESTEPAAEALPSPPSSPPRTETDGGLASRTASMASSTALQSGRGDGDMAALAAVKTPSLLPIALAPSTTASAEGTPMGTPLPASGFLAEAAAAEEAPPLPARPAAVAMETSAT